MKEQNSFRVRIKFKEGEAGALLTFRREKLNEAFTRDAAIAKLDEDARRLATIQRILNNITEVEGLYDETGSLITVDDLRKPIEQSPLYQDTLTAIIYSYGEARKELSEKKVISTIES